MLIKYLLNGGMKDFQKKVWHLIPAAYMNVVSVPSKCILFIEEKKCCNGFIMKLVKLNMKDKLFHSPISLQIKFTPIFTNICFFSWLQSYLCEHLEKAWQ